MRRNRPPPRGHTNMASAKDHLPVARRRMLREPDGRVRYLTDEDEPRLMKKFTADEDRERVAVEK